MLKLVIAAVLAYLAGSLSFGILIPRFFGTSKDIRQEGSGNAGASNVLRTQGKLQGALVLIGDLLKGTLAAGLGLWLAGDAGGGVAGIFAMLGHCFPVFFGFKGGKGVATGAGVVLALMPLSLPVMLLVFVLAAALSRMASLASLLGALTLIVCVALFQPPIPTRVFCAFAVVVVIWKHKANIRRILAGTENKFGGRGGPS